MPIETINRNELPHLVSPGLADLGHQRGTVWLDSSLRFSDRGRFTLIGHDPVAEMTVSPDGVVHWHSQNAVHLDIGLPWETLLESAVKLADWTAVGYVSYEAAAMLAGLPCEPDPDFPLVHFFFYDSMQCLDHDHDDRSAGGSTLPTRDALARPSDIRFTVARDDYISRVTQIKGHIREGDIYQANFTNRIDVRAAHDPWDVYLRLRDLNPAPYGAFLNFGDYQVLSSSPERMFRMDGKIIRTSPIKGTIACGTTPKERAQNRQQLLASVKDRAELMMIVDLERNDLGRIADAGSVIVESLTHAEEYSSVIHLVSDIKARLKDGCGLADVLRAMLPGGSITGAPKLRAMEILGELEQTPRTAYTGVIGYVNSSIADFNIAIRTMVHRDGRYEVYAGGGIVADSDPEAEYQEMLLKASNMLKSLGVDGSEWQ